MIDSKKVLEEITEEVSKISDEISGPGPMIVIVIEKMVNETNKAILELKEAVEDSLNPCKCEACRENKTIIEY